MVRPNLLGAMRPNNNNHRRTGSGGQQQHVSEENWSDFHSKHHSNAYHFSTDNEKYVRQHHLNFYPPSPPQPRSRMERGGSGGHKPATFLMSHTVRSLALHGDDASTPRSAKAKLASSSRQQQQRRRSRTLSPSRKYRSNRTI